MLLAVVAFACQKAKDEFVIKGNIAGAESGKVYLMKLGDTAPEVVDSATMEKGKFSFKGKMEVPDFMILRLNSDEIFAQFFLDNSKVIVEAKKDSLRKTKVTGSPTNDIFMSFSDEMTKTARQLSEVQSKYMKAAQSGNVSEADNARIDYQSLMENSMTYVKNFAKQHSNSVVGAFVTISQLYNQIEDEELDAIVNGFSPEIEKSKFVIQLKQIVEKHKVTALGAVAPDFTLNTPEDKPLTLSSLRGKVVLVDFWASWCAPCRQENPNIVKLYNQYHDKGFDILGVSLDRDKNDWLKAIKDDKLNWNQVSDLKYWDCEAARIYSVSRIPQSYLLDKDGVIIAKGDSIRGEGLAKKLAELFPN